MGIQKWLVKQGGKAADKVTKLSALSPSQVESINKKRDEYYSALADKEESITNTALTEALLASGSVEVFDAYLPQIKDLYVPVSFEEMYRKINPVSRIRYFNVTKWVTNKDENSLEKLVNVYSVLSNENCNIALIFQRTIVKTNVYIAVTDTGEYNDNNSNVESYSTRIESAVRGNFPGSEICGAKAGNDFLDFDLERSSVAAVTNIPTESSEKFISQTIEKLLDGIIPNSKKKEYTLILLATPVRDIEERKLRLAEIYSGFSSYSSWQTSFTYTESDAEGSSANFGVNAGVSAGIQNGQNSAVNTGSSEGDMTQESKSDGEITGFQETGTETLTEGDNKAISDNSAEAKAINNQKTNNHMEQRGQTHGEHHDKNTTGSIGAHANFGGAMSPISGGVSVNVSTGTTFGTSSSNSTSVSDGTSVTFGSSQTLTTGTTHTTGTMKSTAKSIAKGVTQQVTRSLVNTLGKTVTKTVSNTVGMFNSVNLGGNFGASFARASNVTATIGKNESITQTFTNYNIKHAMELIEEQMKRYEQCSAMGMWDFAAYVVSEDVNVANNVAHNYLALTQGEKSYMSRSAVNLWRGDTNKANSDSISATEICKYLHILHHPVFGFDPRIVEQYPDYNIYPPIVTATTNLSGKELAYSLNMPKKSIAGLPVFECAEFGRNITTYDEIKKCDEKFELGDIFHMHQSEKQKVTLDSRSLASHTFITGSTGSGKSNTVYTILDEACRCDKKFLVIEPAKGEYKHIFGNRADVHVYGTNPKLMPLLRLDPFSFPEDIHVLEHMDRLVEIFNVCWPMYAAMPAVLKNAIEDSYKDCGWDLITSTNEYGDNLYPTFADIASNVLKIIDNSEYDTDNKGAYKGSLLTRLRSLTNGINGMLFCNNEISATELFDENVIIDLSRVGSSETKSLIMGILILKLQEYRMTSSDMNSELKHITVLEEAHNILKRTSSEQSMESGNLIGKSVEMISNAIAEMRTYGEGFIIADQAPALLDMSVIRNTNTKIIMRLPDMTDRELVGRAAAMNDGQIDELAKLPCGVAAVYQNEWINPVLCKIQRYEQPEHRYTPPENSNGMDTDDKYNARVSVAFPLIAPIPKAIKEMLDKTDILPSSKVFILRFEKATEVLECDRHIALSKLFPDITEKLNEHFMRYGNIEATKQLAQKELRVYYERYLDEAQRDLLENQQLNATLMEERFHTILNHLICGWSMSNNIEYTDNPESKRSV